MNSQNYQPTDELFVRWRESVLFREPQRGSVCFAFNRGDVTRYKYADLKSFIAAGACDVISAEEAARLTTPAVL